MLRLVDMGKALNMLARFCFWLLQIAEVERVVTEGVELLVHRPLEVSPFNEDEPQVLRHASTREAFVRLVHYYLLLAEVRRRNIALAPRSEIP